jgi:two-component system response regulator
MEQTLLIIDDEEDDVLITERVLSEMGREIRIKVANSGPAALALLQDREELPALILLDRKMPGMDGLGVLRRIRADKSLSHIPVVIVSHSTLESDVTEAYAAGADSVLHKALDLDQFSRDIESVLERWLTG